VWLGVGRERGKGEREGREECEESERRARGELGEESVLEFQGE
jgi:hypothetical protein